MEKVIDSFMNCDTENFLEYFEDYRFNKLQKVKEYTDIKNERNKIFDKYPSVRDLFENENIRGYSADELRAIEEVFRLEDRLNNLEIKEAFKLGAKEFIVFAIEQDLIKLK